MAGKGYRGAPARCGRSVGIAKERLKSRLLEVMIVREGSRETLPDHDLKRGTIRLAPLLVASLRIQRERLLKLQTCLGDDHDVRIPLEILDETYRGSAKKAAVAAELVQKLSQNHLAGNDEGPPQRL